MTAGYVWVRMGTYWGVAAGETVLTVMGREVSLALDRIILAPQMLP